MAFEGRCGYWLPHNKFITAVLVQDKQRFYAVQNSVAVLQCCLASSVGH